MTDAQLRQRLNDATISFKLEGHTFDYVKRAMINIQNVRHDKWKADCFLIMNYLEHINAERL